MGYLKLRLRTLFIPRYRIQTSRMQHRHLRHLRRLRNKQLPPGRTPPGLPRLPRLQLGCSGSGNGITTTQFPPPHPRCNRPRAPLAHDFSTCSQGHQAAPTGSKQSCIKWVGIAKSATSSTKGTRTLRIYPTTTRGHKFSKTANAVPTTPCGWGQSALHSRRQESTRPALRHYGRKAIPMACQKWCGTRNIKSKSDEQTISLRSVRNSP